MDTNPNNPWMVSKRAALAARARGEEPPKDPLFGAEELAARPHDAVIVFANHEAARSAQFAFSAFCCVGVTGHDRTLDLDDLGPLICHKAAIYVWPGLLRSKRDPTNAAKARDRGLRVAKQLAARVPGSVVLKDVPDPATIAPADAAAWLREHLAPEPDPAPAAAQADPAALNGFDASEDGIALAFTAAHRDQLRYDHDAGKWFRWNGAIWQPDETRLAFSWCRAICRQRAKQRDAAGRTEVVLAKAVTASAVEKFAQADQDLAVTSAIWDRDPWLLGTPGGTVDLRTGKLRPANRGDHITKQAAVTPSLMPDCPLWLSFLHDATKGDGGLIRFLRQWLGYSLTGITREHALAFVHGTGGNGKGVFLTTCLWLLGDYAQMAAMETFTASPSDKHPTDLAMLRGARVVAASETEEGRAWAENRIKALTGGDPITARFMRQDFFTFTPSFKLIVIGNHRPILRNVDEAARRRFNMIPFVHQPPKPDGNLIDKLRGEGAGILRWAIEGCQDWQINGLVRPQVVIDATAEYFSEQDSVRTWIAECCETGGRNISDTTANLFRSWTAYALASGEKPGTERWFSQNLARQGCEPVKDTPGNRNKRGFLRIEVRRVDVSDQWQNRMDC